ncbi:hypothetical protein Q8A73_002634 [Channa argus]|nr:hypothetical protein Q8A73_002634 [Channa argus]
MPSVQLGAGTRTRTDATKGVDLLCVENPSEDKSGLITSASFTASCCLGGLRTQRNACMPARSQLRQVQPPCTAFTFTRERQHHRAKEEEEGEVFGRLPRSVVAQHPDCFSANWRTGTDRKEWEARPRNEAKQVFLIHGTTGPACKTQLMTRPSYQLMMGEDGKLVSLFPSFSPHLRTACHSLGLFVVINPSMHLGTAN